MTLTAGCGCGGSTRTSSGSGGCGGGCGGGCSGCGSTGAPVRTGGALRPRFFGGMLLTEDDLAAGIDYFAAKRRLTNRSVFGTGVVCGLDVTCDPCDAGFVTVTPGYALDCCGNDIVVECAERVDVLALIRELRDRTGVDCGEPCPDPAVQEYVLNIVYAEQQTEPVAPYVQDDCTVGECDYSRVREGYRFELSCDAVPAERNLIDVLRDCFATQTDRVKEGSKTIAHLVNIAAAYRDPEGGDSGEVSPAPAEPPAKEEFDAVAADAPMVDALDVIGRAVSALAADAAAPRGEARLTPARRRLLSVRSRELARQLQGSDELGALAEPERLRVQRVLTLADQQHDLGQLDERDRVLLASGFTSDSAEEVFVRDAARMRAEVLRGLTDSGRSGCVEYRKVAALPLKTLDADSYRQMSVLGRTWVSVLMRCLCGGVNPPCPTCTDLRVPLARIRLEDCEIVDVCALERHWVPTPHNLAYWFPVVELLRELLERRCCTEVREVETRSRVVIEREVDLLRTQALVAARLVRPSEEIPVLRTLMEAMGDQFVPQRTPDPDDWGTDADPKVAAMARVSALEAEVATMRSEISRLRTENK